MSVFSPLIQSYRRIAPGDRRALLLMFVFLAGVAGYLLLLEPLVMRYQGAQRGLQELADRQRGYRQQVRVLAQREARWREHGAELQQLKSQFELATGDAQSAVARVIPELIDYARLCAVEVSGLRPLDAAAAGNYLELPLEAEIEGGFADLQRFFYLVDTSPSILAVTDLDLRPQGGGSLRARVKISHVIGQAAGEGDATPVEPVETSRQLRIGDTGGLGTLPLAVARHNGYLGHDGFDLRPIRLDDGADAARLLQSGALDTLPASLPELLEIHARGPALRLILFLGELRGGYALVAAGDSGLRKVGELRGARVGVDDRGPLPFALHGLLRTAGLADGAVRTQAMRHRLVERELLAGTLQAGLLAEPTLTRLLGAGRVRELAAARDERPPIPYFFAVSEKAAEQRPAALRQAVQALARALEFIAANPDETARIGAERNGWTVDEANAALSTMGYAAPDRLTERLTGEIPGFAAADYRAYFAAAGKPFPPDGLRGMVEPGFLAQPPTSQAANPGGTQHGG